MYNFIILIIITSILFPYISADAIGENGVVVSSKKIASDIGINILKNGGNAIDAAVAVSFALSVTHPSAGNLGGGGFMVIKFSNGQSTSIDFREVAPLKSHKDMFLDNEGNAKVKKYKYIVESESVFEVKKRLANYLAEDTRDS